MKQLGCSHKKRNIVIGIVIVLIIGAFIGVGYAVQQKPVQTGKVAIVARSTAKKKTEAPKQETIRLIASGDELPHDSINTAAKTAASYDYTPFFSNVTPVFSGADIRFCNQEVPSAAPDQGAPTGYPAFNAPKEFAHDINKVGCNVINTATNHSNDRLQAGITTTQNTWDGLNKLAVAGGNRSVEEQNKVRYFTVKGVLFAFLAYNYESNNKNLTSYGVNMFDEGLMSRQLTEAKAKGAYTLVSVHWGTEDSSGIDAAQTKWSTFLANNGADVVLGTGPHVIEPVKKLPKKDGGETLVWYSLGNMLSTQLKVEELIGGFAVMDFTVKDSKPQLTKIGFLPTYMHYEWTAAEKASQTLLARKNIKIFLLEQAAEPLARSQNGTSVEVQMSRVKALLNAHTQVPILSMKEYSTPH